ncbi:MAG: helix-turn-helix domain-containing protein [Planctomycetota bacterium]
MAKEHRTLIQPGDPLVAECVNENWSLRPPKPGEVPNAIALDDPSQVGWIPWLESLEQPHDDSRAQPYNCIVFDTYEHSDPAGSPTQTLRVLALAMVASLLKAEPSSFASGFVNEREVSRIYALNEPDLSPTTTPSGRHYFPWIQVAARALDGGTCVARSTFGQMIALADRLKPVFHAERQSGLNAGTSTERAAERNRPALDSDMIAILRMLAEQPNSTMYQHTIAAGSGASRPTVSRRLRELVAFGFVHQPRGAKGGWQITAAGLQLPEIREHIRRSSERI